jgi:hypothetical protein
MVAADLDDSKNSTSTQLGLGLDTAVKAINDNNGHISRLRNVYFTGPIPVSRNRIQRNSHGKDKATTSFDAEAAPTVVPEDGAMALPVPADDVADDLDAVMDAVKGFGLEFDEVETGEGEIPSGFGFGFGGTSLAAAGGNSLEGSSSRKNKAPPSAHGPLIGPPPNHVQVELNLGELPRDLESIFKLLAAIADSQQR